MPWYISFGRVTYCVLYSIFSYVQLKWIMDAEDRYRRSLSWRPAVGVITDHHQIFNKLGASHVWYRFKPDGEGGQEYKGDTFRSGGIFKEEPLKHANLLGVGTELVVYYNPGDPNESALKIAVDRHVEAYFAFNVLLCGYIAYRCVRCETILPNMFYRFLNVNHRLSENTGMRIPKKNKTPASGPKPGAQRTRL